MSPAPGAVVQGTLEMLVMKTLELEPLHAYGVGVRLQQVTGGVLTINAGSLFPAFRRLEHGGLIKGTWQATENNRRAKYYTLTPKGRRRLDAATKQWDAQAHAIALVMGTTARAGS